MYKSRRYKPFQDFSNVITPKFDILELNKNLNGIIRKYLLKDYNIMINLKCKIKVNTKIFDHYKKMIKQCGVKNLKTLDTKFIKNIDLFICLANIDQINKLKKIEFIDDIINDSFQIDL
jgi:hypothetical protein